MSGPGGNWRKGTKFGTIVVDLERRRVVDLLADRVAARMADWFKQHPEVEIINRDRDGLYADAARQGAPQARQVADRFHLLKNLRETIARQLGGFEAPIRESATEVEDGQDTPEVVVGDLIGAGAAQEQAIVGETPNLAARLQGIANPNTVVIAESTRRLLGNLFEFEDIGPQDLKGTAGPAPAWAALRARSVESRFEALHAADLTAFVGREEESELLLRRWSKAKTREGQVVPISGEAGIGKSRLTAVLLERLAGEPHTRLRYFCSPQHTDSALYPIIGQMERAAGFAYDDKPQARLDKLDAVLGQTSAQDAALFAEMLSLPNDGRYPALDLTPQQHRQRTDTSKIETCRALPCNIISRISEMTSVNRRLRATKISRLTRRSRHPGEPIETGAAIRDQDGGTDATRFLSFTSAVASFS
jgi:class 3 adenylate cyclase